MEFPSCRWHRLALAVVFFQAAACAESHEVFDGSRDGGGADALVHRDAGRRDAGARDSGPPHDAICGHAPPPAASHASCGPSVAPVAGCGAGLCGNGTLESCPSCYPCFGGGRPGDPPGPPRDDDGGVCCTTASEACDGTDFGGQTCESLGYGPGTLRCGDSCSLDARGCSPCACDDRIVACGQLDVDASAPTSLSLVVTADGSIAIAWVAGGHVHFARIGADLGVLAEAPCFGPTDASSVSLATSPSGWLVAVGTPTQVVVVPLGSDGSPRGETTNVGGEGYPRLASRPGAAPLLVVTSYGLATAAQVMLLDDAGTPTTTAGLFAEIVEPEYGSAVWAGDAFLVAMRTGSGVATARVELDGRVSAMHRVGSTETEYPQIAADVTGAGSGARITWADFAGTPTIFWQTLDANGAPVGDVVTVSERPADYAPAPITTDGEDSVVFLPGDTGWTGHGGRVAVERLDAAGDVVVAPFRIDAQPQGFLEYRVAMLGSDALLAWIGPDYPGGIVLARVTPE